MNILETIFLISMFILFPLFCYFLFAINERNFNKRISEILFDVALYSSLYLVFRCQVPYIGIKIMFLTVPLLIAFLRSKFLTSIIFSICICCYYIFNINIHPVFAITEFSIYLLFMYILKKRGESDITLISVFAIIKIAFIILELNDITTDAIQMMKEVIILPFAFYFTVNLIYFLMSKSEKAMSLHMTIKELEHQKQLRDSLFKITHEIKNPIAVCKGYLEMLDIDNESHVKRYIPIIRQEIDRTLTLMNDFMMLTKLNVEKRKMDVSVLLQDVYEISATLFSNNKVDFKCSIIDEEVYIDGDYDRLKQVFINMMKNAMESIPDNKKGLIKFNTRVTSKELIITISDNGIGMSKQTMAKIGEAFYTTKKGGTGLGVKFSKEIIDSHNGFINYKSKPDCGTTVTIVLPLKKSLK